MKFNGLTIALGIIAVVFCLFRVSEADFTSVREGTLQEKAREGMDFVIQADVDLTGKIQIISNQTGDIRIAYTITAMAESKTEANRFLDLLDIKMDTNRRDKAFLEVIAPSYVPWGGSRYSVNLELLAEIPEKMNIEGECRFMDVG